MNCEITGDNLQNIIGDIMLEMFKETSYVQPNCLRTLPPISVLWNGYSIQKLNGGDYSGTIPFGVLLGPA
jgi:hypothetical protein